jgi:hypothetical protein
MIMAWAIYVRIMSTFCLIVDDCRVNRDTFGLLLLGIVDILNVLELGTTFNKVRNNFLLPLTERYFVIAAVNVVLPSPRWPI